ncbi:MAG: ABC transporter substrate-binding protein [Nitrososphaerota archaeon]|nr:ABC transporter substrate-binding protein [Nitrososphaerota archaeon]MDG7024803.1 ABC transporter substrate-binding protein [Nitrososphaerota archaeon]
MGRVFSEVLGYEVLVPDSPQRIVSFSPAATETLFLLGLGEKVAAVSAFCARPEAARAKRRIGSYNSVRDDALAELRPDLVLTVTGYQREFALRLSKKYPVYPLELPVSVAGIVDFVNKVGLVTGAAEPARELAGSLLRRVGGLGRTSDLRSYVEIDLGGPVSFGSFSYITDAFRLLGSPQIYEKERSEWLKPDLDWVAAQGPDVIVYEPKMYSSFSAGDVVSLLASRGWEGLRAVGLGNVFVTPGPLDFLAHHGPSFITEALPWLEGRLKSAKERIGT